MTEYEAARDQVVLLYAVYAAEYVVQVMALVSFVVPCPMSSKMQCEPSGEMQC